MAYSERRLCSACVLQQGRECGEAHALARAIADGASGVAHGRIQLEVRALRELSYSFDEAAAFSAALDGRALDLLAARAASAGALLAWARALQELSARRGRLLARAYFPAVAPPPEPLPEPSSLCGLVGRTPAMQRLFQQIQTAARGRETILVVGESGVGKELVARAIHMLSGDKPERFSAVNCAAIPRELLESELYGYRRGAFSGALCNYPGLVRAASGGTLFLDEITELAPEAQAKLLRTIQERSVRGVGETREVPVAVRFVASTNRPLAEALAGGALRRDLYYRLQRFVIEVPPLRERMGDLPLLVEHFAARWRASYSERRAPRFDAAVHERLAAHRWPGNVRELENAVFRACASARGPEVAVSDLELRDEGAAAVPSSQPEPLPPGVLSLQQAEAVAIRRALEQTSGNKSHASRLLGISRKQLYVKLRQYGLSTC